MSNEPKYLSDNSSHTFAGLITVSLNGVDLSTDPGTVLKKFLEQHNLFDRHGLAIALNNKVIPRSKWQDTHLAMNDSILAIIPTQGG